MGFVVAPVPCESGKISTASGFLVLFDVGANQGFYITLYARHSTKSFNNVCVGVVVELQSNTSGVFLCPFFSRFGFCHVLTPFRFVFGRVVVPFDIGSIAWVQTHCQ